MKRQKYHVYWIKDTFRWNLIVTYTPILPIIKNTTHTHFIEVELVIAPSLFYRLTKEQSFHYIKNGDFAVTTHTTFALPEVEKVEKIQKPNVKEYVFITNIIKHIA